MVIQTPLTGTPYERLYPFARDFLGYTDMMPQPHWEMCEFLEQAVKPLFDPFRPQVQEKSMMLVPRGCFKTTIGSVALTIWLLIQLPNLRILLDSHTHGFSQEILFEIKEHLQSEKFMGIFGDWEKDSGRWSEDSIVINKRTQPRKEPSIQTSGVDKSKAGGHFDLIIADDIVDEKGVTEIGIRRTRRHFNRLVPILETNGCQLVTGTRWAFNDVYGFLLEKDRKLVAAEKEAEYKRILHHGAWKEDGSLYFPTKLTADFLYNAKLSMTDKDFAVWYLNEPIEGDFKVFPRRYIQFYKPSPGAGTDGGYIFDRQPFLEVVRG